MIDRLNQVLGAGNWGYQADKIEKVFEGQIDQRNGKVFATSYIAKVVLFATIDGKQCVFSDIGYGDGTDKTNPGKAHELGTKEAVSDGFKRCAKNLGRSMGLALYDKTQEFVGESTANTTPVSKPEPVKSANVPANNLGTTSPRPIKDLITTAFKVLEAQKKITKDEFKAKYQQGKGLSTFTPKGLEDIYAQVKTDFPQLNLN